MVTFEDIKRKSRKTLQKMVLRMSQSVDVPPSSVPTTDAVNWKEIESRYKVIDKMIVSKCQDGVEITFTLKLDDETYQYLKTVTDGRGQSMSDCLSEYIRFGRENAFL